MRHLAALSALSLVPCAAAQCTWLPGHSHATSPLNGNIPALFTWDRSPLAPILAVSSSFPQVLAQPVKLGFFDGSIWSTPPAGFNILPAAFSAFGGALIVGGFAGSATGPTIASWNGQSWGQLGTGVDNPVRALTVHNGHLVAGGEFFTAGDVPVNKIARWDGSQWHDVGGGVTGSSFPMVFALTSFNGNLIAGGFFAAAGGVPATHIASWDGEQWSALGEGRPGAVQALTVFEGKLIAGGAGPIAQWDGQAWSTLGSGVNGAVRTLTVFKNELIAGGNFTTAGGQPANRIARWNGTQWSPMNSGLINSSFGGGDASAMAIFENHLAVGGFFDTAGGQPSVNFARWACTQTCYANCDSSTASPLLTANDFACFLTRFVAGDPYANCDNSTSQPLLTANDFTCFITRFAAGCP